MALTFTDIEPNSNADGAAGNATVHGSASISMIEPLDGDGGTRPPRHATVDATF